jgi:hypothetical protein
MVRSGACGVPEFESSPSVATIRCVDDSAATEPAEPGPRTSALTAITAKSATVAHRGFARIVAVIVVSPFRRP